MPDESDTDLAPSDFRGLVYVKWHGLKTGLAIGQEGKIRKKLRLRPHDLEARISET